MLQLYDFDVDFLDSALIVLPISIIADYEVLYFARTKFSIYKFILKSQKICKI